MSEMPNIPGLVLETTDLAKRTYGKRARTAEQKPYDDAVKWSLDNKQGLALTVKGDEESVKLVEKRLTSAANYHGCSVTMRDLEPGATRGTVKLPFMAKPKRARKSPAKKTAAATSSTPAPKK